MTVTPITIGTIETPWTILVNAPLDRMLAGVYKMRNTSILMAAGFLVLLGILVYFMARIVIVTPLNKVIESLTDISEGEGDLTQRLEIKTHDELGQLSTVFNAFIEKLQHMMKDISSGVNTLSSSSTELSSISEQMSSGADQTSEKSQTVAAATEEMTTIALRYGPDQVSLVPERPEEVTTEGGLDLLSSGEMLIANLSQVPPRNYVEPLCLLASLTIR